MKRGTLAAVVCGFLVAAPTSQTMAASVDVEQSGDYNLTIARQHGTQTNVVTRQINERVFERLNFKLGTRMERMTGIYQRRAERLRAHGRELCHGEERGARNDVQIAQDGANNVSVATQLGAGDRLTTEQIGDNNSAYALQFGNNQTARTYQSGDNNIAFIIQRCR